MLGKTNEEQLAVLANTFNCRVCLLNPSPKELTEDPINVKIIELNLSMFKIVYVNILVLEIPMTPIHYIETEALIN